MCCLFGLIDTAQYFTRQQKNDILHALATVSEARGQDATGVAYCHKGALMVSKRPVPGHIFPLQIPYDAAVIMGHTRLTTQGSEKKNYNIFVVTRYRAMSARNALPVRLVLIRPGCAEEFWPAAAIPRFTEGI